MKTIRRGRAASVWKFLATSLLALASTPALATGQIETYSYDAAGNLVRISRVADGSPLAIASFSPMHGEVGTRVVISGVGFSSTPAADIVTFNGTVTPVLAATTTQLLVAVPSGATTGPISVSVASTTATSSDPFTIGSMPGPPHVSGLSPPSGSANSIITVFGTDLAPGGQTAVSINGVSATVTSPGDLQTSFKIPSNVGSGPVTVTTPYGQSASSSILQVVPASISPANVTWKPALQVNGASQSVSVAANKYAAFVFQGHVGDFLSIQLSSFTSADNALTYSVIDPLGVQITSGTMSPAIPQAHIPALHADGYYSVFLGAGSGADQFSVSLVSDPSLPVDATATNVSTMAGQSPRFVFSATAGDNLGIGIRNLAITNTTGDSIQVFVYKPDGTQLASNTACRVYYGGCDFNLVNLPITGTYALLLAPAVGSPQETMSLDLALSHDLIVPLPPSTQTSMTLAMGQNGRYTFSGAAGASMGLQVGGVTTTPSGKVVGLTVLKPDGATLVTGTTTGGFGFNLKNLPVTGTYTLFVDPQYAVPASLTANLLDSASAAVTVDGSSSTISTMSMPGSYGYFTFTASQGENIGMGIRDIVVGNTTSDFFQVFVYKPDGTQLASNTTCRIYYGGCDFNLSNVPQTGTYAVLTTTSNATVSPQQTMSFTVNVTHDLVVPLPTGTETNMALAMGQNGRYTFSGTAGASMGLRVGGVTTTPSGKIIGLTVFKPDGTTLATGTTTGGFGFNLKNLPVTGTYTLFVDPQYAVPASLTANLLDSASAAVTVDGSSSTISTMSMPGSYAYVTFTATQGENLGIGLRDLVMGNTTGDAMKVFVYKPDGTQLATEPSCRMYYGGCEFNLGNVPQSGSYVVLVTPYNVNVDPRQTMSFTINVTHDVLVPLTPATPSNMTLAIGQNGRFTFNGTAGTSATVQITSIVTSPAGKTLALLVLKPDGSTLSNAYASTSFTLNLTNLPVTGSYTVFVDPASGVSATLQGAQP